MSAERPADTIGGALALATARLRAEGLDRPRLDAELLLGHVLGLTRTRLAIDANDRVDSRMLEVFSELLTRRLAGEPVAYLVGHREFMGHDFQVGPGVLVPRPETEMLVERAISMIDRLWPDESVRTLDCCTGSGAIALSLALELRREDTEVLRYDRVGEETEVLRVSDKRLLSRPSRVGKRADTGSRPYPSAVDGSDAEVLSHSDRIVRIAGSDISLEALRYARANRDALGLQDQVGLVQGDLLSWTAGPWDLILSNPPYLRPGQIDGNVEIGAEPRLALDGGANGLELIERLLDRAVRVAAPRFGMMIEHDPDHADAVCSLAAARFPTADVIIVPDLTGRDRFVSIEREETAV